MIVAASSRETALSGRPAEYLELARILEQGHGTVRLDADADVQPYDMALATIEVSESSASGVSIAIDGQTLRIQGPRESLGILADVVRDSAHAGDPDGHVHIDYFPGHEYLSENSVPMVIADARS